MFINKSDSGMWVVMKPCRKYGLFTAIAMVTGSVIGSGVFFKAEAVAGITAGNIRYGTAAWILGGMSMILCLLSFAIIYSFVNENADLTVIAEKTAGRKYAYFSGWFMATVYYPALACVLSWLCASYTLQAIGAEDPGGGLCMVIAGVFLVVSFAQNALFPNTAGKVQVVTTVLKLIPLVLMIVLGIIKGFSNGTFEGNLLSESSPTNPGKTLFKSVSAVMFAYEGWIAALCIGPELKNRERNLPKALVLGGSVVLAVYILYYVGILGAVSTEILLNYGRDGVKMAFSNIVGEKISGLLLCFVAISCFGALNGMMFSLGRAMYSLGSRGQGPTPSLFSEINRTSETPIASFSAGLVFAFLWLFFLFGNSLADPALFGKFGFDISEVPVVTVYAMYIPIFVFALKKWGKDLNKVKTAVIILGIASCIFTAGSAFVAHIEDIWDYIFVFTAIMLAGAVFYKK